MVKLFKSLADVTFIKGKNKASSELGSGAYGQVQLVTHVNDPSIKYAMKAIKKYPEQVQKIYQEIKLHENLQHPNIIKFVDYIETQDQINIFLEFAENGDLFSFVRTQKFDEKELLRLFYQSCIAIQYLHS